LDNRIVDAAIRAHCVDITPPPHPNGRARPVEYTAWTVSWHPGLQPPRVGTGGPRGDELPAPSLSGLPDAPPAEVTPHARAVATSMKLQSLVRAARAAARPAQAARGGKPSAADQAAAAALYEQLSIGDAAADQDDDQEPELAPSPEQLVKLEQGARDMAERAAAAPRAKKRKGASGSGAGVQRPKPGYRPRRR
jgi:hypothetical protein